jgi:hypothetical protein
MSQRRKIPSEKTIRMYWANTDIWQKKGLGSSERFLEVGFCFACCYNWGGTQKAHIYARVYSQDDSVQNLHMLCPECHTASEPLMGEGYWAWFFDRTREEVMWAYASKANMASWLTREIELGEEAFQLLIQRSEKYGLGFRT